MDIGHGWMEQNSVQLLSKFQASSSTLLVLLVGFGLEAFTSSTLKSLFSLLSLLCCFLVELLFSVVEVFCGSAKLAW